MYAVFASRGDKSIHRKEIAIPGVSAASATAEAAQVIAWFRSPGFAADLLIQPEPTPEELAQFLDGCKNGLARLRQLLIDSSKAGPRQKRGKGTKKIDGPIRRESVRQEIKDLRDSKVLLKDIYKRLGRDTASARRRSKEFGSRNDRQTRVMDDRVVIVSY
jgi:hypothetical protein